MTQDTQNGIGITPTKSMERSRGIAGRKPIYTPEQALATKAQRCREKIAADRVITKLQGHVDGTVDMTATQVQAAKILLDRVVPPLKPFDIQTLMGPMKSATHLTPEFLMSIIEGQYKQVDSRTEVPVSEESTTPDT